MPCEDEGRDWVDTSMNQGTPKMSSKPPEARRKAWTRFSSTASEGTNTADTLILDF